MSFILEFIKTFLGDTDDRGFTECFYMGTRVISQKMHLLTVKLLYVNKNKCLMFLGDISDFLPNF